MGVTGLWQILHPCARPIKLETLNRRRLAVDASIWIYQFLKAVRDKEGNALRNSHVVGFFRRICKLLFFGIQPVFVFDGGAPGLKRQTINARKHRREGRREDAVRTAGKLLAVQMQRRAEEEEQRRKQQTSKDDDSDDEAVPPESLVYVDEVHMTPQERQQSRKFKKTDAYHLPDLHVGLNEMGAPNDPRIMSLEELQAYAKQFETGEDINVYDFSKIDYDSPFFVSLPPSDRYNILNAARLRSRLRMGHSKEQLDNMFPDRMAFSKFQIERVRERNELTQRLMHINEGGDTLFNGGRVAGEKGREYVLVKNDGVEGGWALGVISDEGTKQENAIDLDKPQPLIRDNEQDSEDDDDDGFEDVPIEGLNRLPKHQQPDGSRINTFARQEGASDATKTSAVKGKSNRTAHSDSLFIPDEHARDEDTVGLEEVDADGELFGEETEQQDEDLRRAIAMSLEQPNSSKPDGVDTNMQSSDAEEDDMLEVFQQSAVPEPKALPKGSGRAIASIVNQRAFKSAPESHGVVSLGGLFPESGDSDKDEDDSVDLQAALAESRRTKRKAAPLPRSPAPPSTHSRDTPADVAKRAGFSGPLPFEKLDLGSSLLGKKKMKERSEELAGGFENPNTSQKAQKKNAEPLPPWFSGNLEDDIRKQRVLETEDRERAKEFSRQFQFQSRGEGMLRRPETTEVVDLEANDEQEESRGGEVIDIDAEEPRDKDTDVFKSRDPKIGMDHVAEEVQIQSTAERNDQRSLLEAHTDVRLPPQAAENDKEVPDSAQKKHGVLLDEVDEQNSPVSETQDEPEEAIEWSDSEGEREQPPAKPKQVERPAGVQQGRQRSPSIDFEDVAIPDRPVSPNRLTTRLPDSDLHGSPPGSAQQEHIINDDDEQAYFSDVSDPEEEELLRALTLEAEEHARFASTLNHKSQAQNIADYENELKQLRNQQKKDRRDADEVTHIMIQECQQLLRLFGLPYITAPMEAEAQCAELVKLGLVDGIVTDDSDCFLFGGTRVYKNMFNQAKFVECYLSSDLEKEFDLTREKLIQIAHLLGSDYTEGLPGVGPVTALEILGEFQTLSDFRDWLAGVHMNAIPKSDDKGSAFRKKFRRSANKIFPPPSFPDTRVDLAYMNPDVDHDTQPFQWGVPDLDALRNFLMATIGWSQERTDEVLVPVIRDMNRRADEGTQSNITAFFEGGVGIGSAGARGAGKGGARGDAFAPRKKVAESSKRMGSALSRMAERAKGGIAEVDRASDERVRTADEIQVTPDESTNQASKKGKAAKRHVRAHGENDEGRALDDDDSSEFEAPRKKARTKKKQSAKARKTSVMDDE